MTETLINIILVEEVIDSVLGYLAVAASLGLLAYLVVKDKADNWKRRRGKK